MRYRYVSYNASENKNLLRFKIQKQYSKNGKWFDVRHNGKIIPFKEISTVVKIVETLNNKNNGRRNL